MPKKEDYWRNPEKHRAAANQYRLDHPEWHRDSTREWAAKDRAKNPERQNAASRRYVANLSPEKRAIRNQRTKEWFKAHPDYARQKQREDHAANPARRMVEQAKLRAKKLGVPYDLDWQEIEIPEACPVLGIPLFGGNGGFQDNSPSLDRLKPTLGYVKGNVRVISWRANVIKRDATLEELEAIVAYMRRGGENGMSGL